MMEEKTDNLKSMYEMGQQLMSMATDMGYDPEASEEEGAEMDDTDMEDTEEETPLAPTKNKASSALSYFKGE